MIEMYAAVTRVDMTATSWCDYLMAGILSQHLPRYEEELCTEWVTTFLRPVEDL